MDGLHQAAGARDVTELHGRLDRVRCLGLRPARPPADELHAPAGGGQPGWHAAAPAINPDGDVDLPDERAGRLPDGGLRRLLGGVLKPDVVFFGETVPRRPGRSAATGWSSRSRSLLVLGSSLTVMSGHRFVLRAARDGGRSRSSTRAPPAATGTRRSPSTPRSAPSCRRSPPASPGPELTEPELTRARPELTELPAVAVAGESDRRRRARVTSRG